MSLIREKKGEGLSKSLLRSAIFIVVIAISNNHNHFAGLKGIKEVGLVFFGLVCRCNGIFHIKFLGESCKCLLCGSNFFSGKGVDGGGWVWT